MFQQKRIAVLGGDERYVYMVEHLASNNAHILAVGFEDVPFKNSSIQRCTIREINFQTLDAVMLPVHGMDKTFAVDQYFPKGKLIVPQEMFTELPKDCLVFSGTATNHLRTLCKKNDLELCALYELEQIAILNALPTAEATLQIAMEQTKRTIKEQTVLISGFGRIAQATSRLFQAVGANVYIVARQQTALATANIQGFKTITFEDLAKVLPNINICINTVPHLIFTEERIGQMDHEAVIIDVASKPGGVDFDAAKKHQMKAIHALGLPGKTAPVTAGEIIAKPVLEKLQEK